MSGRSLLFNSRFTSHRTNTRIKCSSKFNPKTWVKMADNPWPFKWTRCPGVMDGCTTNMESRWYHTRLYWLSTTSMAIGMDSGRMVTIKFSLITWRVDKILEVLFLKSGSPWGSWRFMIQASIMDILVWITPVNSSTLIKSSSSTASPISATAAFSTLSSWSVPMVTRSSLDRIHCMILT